MDWNYLTLPASALALAAAAFVYTYMQSKAFDRKWGRHHPPGE